MELGYIAAPAEDVRQTIRNTIHCNQTNLIRALLGTPQEARAVPLLKELLAGNSANEWCLLTLARCQIRLARLLEARNILEAVRPDTQQLSQVQLLFAELAFAEKNPAGVLNHLQIAEHSGTGVAVNQPLLFNQLGRAYLQLERWEDAWTAFQKSLTAEPENPAAFDGLASVHLERAEPGSAVEKALQAVGLVHFFPEAHFHLGKGLERLGQAREAIMAYETALGMGYRPDLLHQRLAELYHPINPQKAASHANAGPHSKKKRIYRADIKSTLPLAATRTD